MRILAHMQIGFILSFTVFSAAYAGPNIPAGDPAIRQNIQRLADAGDIKAPSPTWPLAQDGYTLEQSVTAHVDLYRNCRRRS